MIRIYARLCEKGEKNFNDVPKNGSPNNVFLSDFNNNHKFDAVAFVSLNKMVLVSLNILGNESEYNKYSPFTQNIH